MVGSTKVTIVSAVIKVQVQLKPIKGGFWHQNFFLCLVFGLLTPSVAFHQACIQNITDYICIIIMASQEDPVVINYNDDWPDAGPQNPEEARAYQDRIN